MNNIFKFRVYDKPLKKYMEFKEFKFMNVEFTFNPIKKEAEIEYDKERYIVEQCTGLKDKNGKLIYDGDLIKSPSNSHVLEVFRYIDGTYMTREYRKNGYNELSVYQFIAGEYGIEVVGNIHQNKELLKEEEVEDGN